jgi:hypothetical protein
MNTLQAILPKRTTKVLIARWAQSASWWVERTAASRRAIYLVFTALFFVPSVFFAHVKLLWDDEFFTLYLSRTSGWTALLQALATGADQHPPSFYYLTHWIFHIFGTGPVTLRLPAMFGFWLMCVCLYETVRSLTTPSWGVVAMLFPLTTNLYYYATEGRGYGLVIGFVALAVLSWFRVTEDRSRRLYLPLLGISLAAAVASHYYAALAVLCIASGEVVRTATRRRIDWPVWIAFLSSALPIALFIRTIQSARGYSTHFWAVPTWSDALFFYPRELALGPLTLLGAVALATVYRFSSDSEPNPAGFTFWRRDVLSAAQATLICCLSALPVIAMFVAKFITHGYTARYAIGALVGVGILLPVILYKATPQKRVPVIAVVLSVVVFGCQWYLSVAKCFDDRDTMGTDIAMLAQTGEQQVAVGDITIFHRLSFYAPRQVAARLNYVANPTFSIEYLGHDTVDRGLLDLNPWFPLKVVPVERFRAQNSQFLMYGTINSWSWLAYEVPSWGDTRLIGRNYQRLLFSVKSFEPSLANEATSAGLNDAESRMLYRQMPQTGPALCVAYMGPRSCPYLGADFVKPRLSKTRDSLNR